MEREDWSWCEPWDEGSLRRRLDEQGVRHGAADNPDFSYLCCTTLRHKGVYKSATDGTLFAKSVESRQIYAVMEVAQVFMHQPDDTESWLKVAIAGTIWPKTPHATAIHAATTPSTAGTSGAGYTADQARDWLLDIFQAVTQDAGMDEPRGSAGLRLRALRDALQSGEVLEDMELGGAERKPGAAPRDALPSNTGPRELRNKVAERASPVARDNSKLMQQVDQAHQAVGWRAWYRDMEDEDWSWCESWDEATVRAQFRTQEGHAENGTSPDFRYLFYRCLQHKRVPKGGTYIDLLTKAAEGKQPYAVASFQIHVPSEEAASWRDCLGNLPKTLHAAGILLDRPEQPMPDAAAMWVVDCVNRCFGPNTEAAFSGMAEAASIRSEALDFASAERIMRQALSMCDGILDKESPTTIAILEKLSGAGWPPENPEDYARDVPVHQRLLSYYQRTSGKESPKAVAAMQDLAHDYLGSGNSAAAVPLLACVVGICESGQTHDGPSARDDDTDVVFGGPEPIPLPSGPDLVYLYWDLAFACLQSGRPEVVPSLARKVGQAADVAQGHWLALGNVREDVRRQTRPMLGLEEIRVGGVLSLLCAVLPSLPDRRDEIVGLAAERMLRGKSVVLTSLVEDKEVLSRNTKAADLARKVTEAEDEFNEAEGLKASQERKLQRKIDGLRAELADAVPGLCEERRALRASVNEVCAAMAPGSCLVEFIRWSDPDRWPQPAAPGVTPGTKTRDDVPAKYAAVVLHPEELRPELLFFGGSSPIEAAVADLRRYANDPERARKASEHLYTMIWAPLEGKLGHVRRIYISPDGVLQFVPFASLGPADGPLLIERFEIGYLASGRDLVHHIETRYTGPAELFGDADFGLRPANTPKAWERSAPPPFSQLDGQTAARLRDRGIDALPWTRREVESLRDQLNRCGIAFELNIGPDASERRLKRVRRPQMLHLATHGFYSVERKDPTVVGAPPLDVGFAAQQEIDGTMQSRPGSDRQDRNPMMRSGLLLAGARTTVATNATGGDDGILTAFECSTLDLQGTELAFLSCCESGLGDIDPYGDGVMGLRRAFTVAGVRQLVLSLWKVDDRQTARIVSYFYEEYLRNGHDAVAAMATIQRNLLSEALKAGRPRPPPAEWASFFVSIQGQAGK
jgi:CHAT domain-containing protein